jgi:hypothetical protein
LKVGIELENLQTNWFLPRDLEEDHLGFFFTKLFYSDFKYPRFTKEKIQNFSVSSEFPCVLAPDFDEGGKRKSRVINEKKKKDHWQEVYLSLATVRKEKHSNLAASIFTPEEVSI